MPELIDVMVGAHVLFDGRKAKVNKIISTAQVLVEFEDGSFKTVHATDLSSPIDLNSTRQDDLPIDALNGKQLEQAKFKFSVIKPILENPAAKEKQVQKATAEFGLARSTIYSWLSKYNASGRLTSLAPNSSARRKSRIDPRIERIVCDSIEELYLTPKRLSQKALNEEINRRCRNAKLKTPHPNTIRARIDSIDQKKRTFRRRGAKVARNAYEPLRGRYNEGLFPLEKIQIDTQKQDIIIVDDKEREPIGRPYVVAGIDVFSKIITGVHVSLDDPSAYTAGQCILASMLPKNDLLKGLELNTNWDIWGVPDTIHMDNGKDFRSESLRRSCEQHGISIEFRPPSFPNWGGVIERFFKTLAHDLHNEDGTTKSNPIRRGTYDSEGQAIYTLGEFKAWLIDWITGYYHLRIHDDLQVTPLQRWEDGVLGKNGFVGKGSIPIPADTHDLRRDFLPSTLRTVSRRGIRWDNIHYYADTLVPWIGEKKGGKSIKHIVRRDPHDLSYIYFFDPVSKAYEKIPYRDLSHPSITLWDLKEAQATLGKRSSNKNQEYEQQIMEYLERKHTRAMESRAETQKIKKSTRRKKQKNRERAKSLNRFDVRIPTNEHKPLEKKQNSRFSIDDNDARFDFSDEDLEFKKGEWG